MQLIIASLIHVLLLIIVLQSFIIAYVTTGFRNFSSAISNYILIYLGLLDVWIRRIRFPGKCYVILNYIRTVRRLRTTSIGMGMGGLYGGMR